MSTKILAIVAALAACNGPKDERQTNAQPAKVKEMPPAQNAAAIELTAFQLSKAYAENEIGADAKYKGKALRVTGIVDHVAREGDGAMLDLLINGGDPVQAHFADASAVGSLQRHQEATVRCYGDGLFGGPQLKSCALETAPAAK